MGKSSRLGSALFRLDSECIFFKYRCSYQSTARFTSLLLGRPGDGQLLHFNGLLRGCGRWVRCKLVIVCSVILLTFKLLNLILNRPGGKMLHRTGFLYGYGCVMFLGLVLIACRVMFLGLKMVVGFLVGLLQVLDLFKRLAVFCRRFPLL